MKIIVINKAMSGKRPPVISVLFILVDLGYKVTLITCDISDKFNKMISDKGIDIYIIPLSNSSLLLNKFINYLKFKLLVFRYLDKTYSNNKTLIWIIDAPTIIALGGKLNKYKFILQIQELHEGSKLYYRGISKVINNAEVVFMPEYSRTFLYQLWYKLNKTPVLLPNKPYFTQKKSYFNTISEKYLNDYPVLKNKKIILYQGGISSVRMLEQIAQALLFFDNYILLLVGNEYEDGYIKIIQKINSSTLHIPYIPAPNYLALTNIAYIGYVCYNPSSLNNIFCAPNKINEYSYFSLPMIANNIPGIKNIFDKYNPGVIVDDNTNSICNAIKEINTNYGQYKKNSLMICEEIDNKEKINTILNNIKNEY